MNNQAILKFKANQLDNLKTINSFLNKTIGNNSNITRVLGDVRNELESLDKRSSEFRFVVSGLTMPITGIKRVSKSAKIIIDLEYTVILDDWNNEQKDFFKDYNCHINIVDGAKKVCWHIDRDDKEHKDEHHPLYHLQITHTCGDNIKECSALFLDSPRLPFPPLDYSLCIGFCLTNFYKKSIMENQFKQSQALVKAYKESEQRILNRFYSKEMISDPIYNPMII